MVKVDINKVDIEDLMKVKGIGKVKAKEIIAYRQGNGPFSQVDDLLEVKGIGKKYLKKINDNISINEGVDIFFNPADYGLEELDEVHLVGEMNNWNPADKTYSLYKRKDGYWVGNFDLEKGTEFKFIYDSICWEDGQDIGNEFGGNLVV